jgi:hypothetical protein
MVLFFIKALLLNLTHDLHFVIHKHPLFFFSFMLLSLADSFTILLYFNLHFVYGKQIVLLLR